MTTFDQLSLLRAWEAELCMRRFWLAKRAVFNIDYFYRINIKNVVTISFFSLLWTLYIIVTNRTRRCSWVHIWMVSICQRYCCVFPEMSLFCTKWNHYSTLEALRCNGLWSVREVPLDVLCHSGLCCLYEQHKVCQTLPLCDRIENGLVFLF